MRRWGRFRLRASSLLPPCSPAGSTASPRAAASPRPAGTACSAWTCCHSKVSLGETPLEAAAAAAPRINRTKASPSPLTLVECKELCSRARCVSGLPHLKCDCRGPTPSCRWIALTLFTGSPISKLLPSASGHLPQRIHIKTVIDRAGIYTGTVTSSFQPSV